MKEKRKNKTKKEQGGAEGIAKLVRDKWLC